MKPTKLIISLLFLFTAVSLSNAGQKPAENPTNGMIKTIGGIEFVYIKGNEFIMGSPANDINAESDEKPLHKVSISDFWIGKFEVTQRQYKDIMKTNPSSFPGNTNPVETVSWYDAVKFCREFNKKYGVNARLPYEAEWEYACRAGSSTKYYWGTNINGNYCWYHDNSDGQSHPVGCKNPNQWGLYDMNGNVWEWCLDSYNENYYKNSPYKDPKGISSGKYKILRGGGWDYFKWRLYSADRNRYYPDAVDSSFGFRIVIPAK